MTVVIVGGDKGGIGKDTVSDGLFIAAVQRQLTPTMFEIEIERRMAVKYPNSIYVPTGAPSPEALYARPDLLFAPLDRAASQMAEQDLAIVNAGASVTTAFIRWSEGDVGRAFFGDGEILHFVCLLTMQDQALRSGFSNLARFGEIYPQARRTAVLNPVVADFVEGDQNIERAIEAATGKAQPINVIKIERMAAPAWGYMMNQGRLDQIASMSWKDLVALGLPEAPSIRSAGIFEGWLKRLLASLGPILPDAKPTNRKAKKE
ncbi:hypothetical protein [Bradyrhizobium sp. Tv2a-2]|uniref:hypothetical protein n=1 Tax=Bradyrhizobium sp. Tv2a-2 TaxID=113395 RepID=UPI0004195E52|nr:hypothetical protein [Bradyrhizobium sp. Tv2a-2]